MCSKPSMTLFKEILEQRPTRGPSKINPKKTAKHSNRVGLRSAKPVQKKKISGGTTSQTNQRCLNSISSDSSRVVLKKKKPSSTKITKYDANIPSSTPMFTPIRKDKLHPSAGCHPSNSISSSQCSLIELLQQYNQSMLNKTQRQDSDVESLARTLTPEPVKDFDDPQLQTFQEVVSKLLKVIQYSNAHDTNTIDRAFNEVQAAYQSINRESTLKLSNSLNEGSVNLEELQLENLSLQRKLRIAEKQLQEKENIQQGKEISFELLTLQCRNGVLEQKVLELTSALEQALTMEQATRTINEQLTAENSRLESDLSLKNDELRKSGNMFASETQEIKRDVGDALEKVEVLKGSLNETSQENVLLSQEIRRKNLEIQRLNELNKGLQSSVSRLLEDLNKAPKPSYNDTNIRTLVLKKFGNALSAPPRGIPSEKNVVLDARAPTNAGGFHPLPVTIPSAIHTNSYYHNSHDDHAETISNSIAPVFGSSLSASLPTTGSVSSSMWSVTSHDEKNFHAGLALLDADIQRLQDNLKRLNTST